MQRDQESSRPGRERQLISRRLLRIANVEPVADDDGVVPGFALEGLERGDFRMGGGIGLDESDLPLFARDEEQTRVWKKANLALSITTSPPLALSGVSLHTREHHAEQALKRTLRGAKTG